MRLAGEAGREGQPAAPSSAPTPHPGASTKPQTAVGSLRSAEAHRQHGEPSDKDGLVESQCSDFLT